MKILIVEDDTVSRKLIGGILTRAGYQILESEGVEQACEFLDRESGLGLIISDIMMPEKNGIDLLKYLKSKPDLKNIPILMCSAVGNKEVILRSINLGAADYLIKPIDADTLLSKVTRIHGEAGKSVMIVDDEKTVRDVLKITLERNGYTVYLCERSEEALNMIDKFKIKLVISDIVMPSMGGLKLLPAIKDKHPNLPVLLMTGMVDQYKIKEISDSGADGFISKPFSSNDIINAVRNHL